MMKFVAVSLLLLVSAGALPAPSNADMARCAAIDAPDARLSCYDALAHRPAVNNQNNLIGTAPAVNATAAASGASSAAVVPAPAAQPPATVASIAADPKNFGLTAVQTHTADLGPKSITAHISYVSSDQSGRTFVVLDSGQTWTVMDSDGFLSNGDAVTIKRAALGSFLMMTPSNHSYRVRRTK